MPHLAKNHPRFTRLILPALVAAITPYMAHADESELRLEEVIVTAQKRAQSLQDVPISVAAISGEKLEDAGIETLEELTAQIPNIHFTETGFSTQVRVRGIGSDNSQGFEQSVGMYVDGIYHGRAQLFRTPMMDMERAEVLRGPQSTLFGKNSIAGALNLTTARPTEELEGQVSLAYEPEYNGQELNAVVSGPLSDEFRARVAIRQFMEDGYFQNTFKNTDEPESDESAFRLSLEWDATDDLSLFLKAERNEFNTVGRPIETNFDVSLQPGGPNYGQILASLGQPALDSQEEYTRQFDFDETSENVIDNITFNADYAINDYTLTFVTGLLDFDYDERCDCDYTASQILPLELGETYEQFSQEIRIASPTDGRFDWIAGLFYQDWDQTFYDDLGISSTNFLPTVASRVSDENAGLALLADTALRRDFEQSSESWAGFGQVTWHATESFRLTLGARYTEEEKEASKILFLKDLDSNEPLSSATNPLTPLIAQVYLGVFGVEAEQTQVVIPGPGAAPIPLAYAGHNVSKERKEEVFNPLVNVEYDINDDMMGYISYTTGFKAGGFDPRSNSVGSFSTPDPFGDAPAEPNPFQWFEFEEERAVAYELGLKTTLLDGRGEFNAAVYRTEYEDLQISQYDGRVGFNVGNAKETIVQGLEIDGRWALTENLGASYGFSWLDFEYTDFFNGNCYAGQPGQHTDVNGDGTFDLCDYTGKRGVYTPDYTLNASLDYRRPLFDGIDLKGFIDWQRVDGHNVHVNLDPRGEIDAYNVVNARIGFDADRWSVALLGRNLLDEYIVAYSANAPLSTNTFGTNTYYSVIRRPRTIAIEGRVTF